MFETAEKRVSKYGNISYWENGLMVGKRCTKCGEDKEICEFNFRNKQKGIYEPKCKECGKKCSKQYCKDNVEHKREYDKRYYKNNAERKKEYSKQRYKNNLEYYKQHNKRWHECIKQNNLEKISNMIEQINPIFKNLAVYGYIYKIENIKTGHVYIGQTIQTLKKRYNNGIIDGWINERKCYENQKFKEELLKEDMRYTEVLDVGICKWHLDKLEAYYIDKYNSCNNGYNNNAGKYDTDDGIEEFNQILKENNLEFTDGKLMKIV